MSTDPHDHLAIYVSSLLKEIATATDPHDEFSKRKDKCEDCLRLTCLKGHVNLLQGFGNLLATSILDINCKKHGRTPLMCAALGGHHECVRFLVDAKAEVNHKDGQSNSALFLALESGHVECVRILAKAGACMETCNDHGQTPLILGCLLSNINIDEYIEHHRENMKCKERFSEKYKEELKRAFQRQACAYRDATWALIDAGACTKVAVAARLLPSSLKARIAWKRVRILFRCWAFSRYLRCIAQANTAMADLLSHDDESTSTKKKRRRRKKKKVDEPAEAPCATLAEAVSAAADAEVTSVEEDAEAEVTSEGAAEGAAEDNVPEELLCPILQTLMVDPVTTATGATYERKAIEDWLARGKHTDPMTGQHLDDARLIPNLAVRSMCCRLG